MVSQQSTLGFLILSLKSEMHLQEFLSCGYFPVGRSLSFCDLWSCFSVLVGIFSKISEVSCLKCHSSCSLLGLGLSRLIAGISARWCAYSQWHRNHCRLFHPCLAMSCSRQGTGSGLGGWEGAGCFGGNALGERKEGMTKFCTLILAAERVPHTARGENRSPCCWYLSVLS